MPIYEYECRACGKKFEQLCRMGEAKAPPCPKCRGRRTERQFSVFGMSGGASARSEGASSSGSSCGGCSRSSCAGCGH